MVASTNLQITPVPGAPFGAQIIGAELRSFGDGEYAAVRDALNKHTVVVFRDQQGLEPQAQLRFSRRFGPLLRPQLKKYTLAGFSDIGVVSNVLNERGEPIGIPNSGRNWHYDVQFDRSPPNWTFLVSRELPDEGGDTLFANTAAVYEALDPRTRRRIDGLRVIHSRTRSWPILYPDRSPLPPEETAKYPDVSHPAVRTHPESGRKSLYMGWNMAMGIEGMADTEAMDLICEMHDFTVRDEFVFAHRWRPGDAVMWDNRSSMHWATWYDDSRYCRVMHRTSFAPAIPV